MRAPPPPHPQDQVRGNCWGEGDSHGYLGHLVHSPPVAWEHARFPQEVGPLILISQRGEPFRESNPGPSDSRTQALYAPTGEQGTKQTQSRETRKGPRPTGKDLQGATSSPSGYLRDGTWRRWQANCYHNYSNKLSPPAGKIRVKAEPNQRP